MNNREAGATPARRWLTSLARDRRGNTLAIVAAAIFPLMGMVGGAVDISRMYIVKTRLQQACDAGALAGRKSMSGITWTSDNEDTAVKFFATNFPDGKYGSKSIDINYDASSTGTVTGTASAVVPMTLMTVFSIADQTISVQCAADLQLPNTDVMFVLDTTLSMNDINPGDSLSRIAVLRTAVQNFYTQLENAKPAGAQVRYGFVPYSSTVNVGMLLKRNWIQDNAVYDSRVADGTSLGTPPTQGGTMNQNDKWQSVSGSVTTGTQYQGPSESCTAPPNQGYTDTSSYTSWSPSSTALPRTRTRTRTRNGTTFSASLKNGICWITPTIYNNLRETQLERVIANPNAGQPSGNAPTYHHWIYQPVPYSMANLKGSGDGEATVTGGSFFAAVANKHTDRKVTWNQSNACIEERATRRSDEGANVPRHDMDVDLVPDPTRPETQWKPYLPGLVYARRAGNATAAANSWVYSGDPATYTRVVTPNSTTDYYTPFNDNTRQFNSCPSPARKLSAIDAATLQTYLSNLNPTGFTYHDIGMLWGLRLMSRDGLFAAENQAAEATGRVARHLIFMTDGGTDTRYGAYDAWGVSGTTRRRTPTAVTPTNATQNAITEARLLELCTYAKNNKNITVWVIAFGTTLTTLLSDCASPERAYQADNADELAETFSQIASQIAQLRVIR